MKHLLLHLISVNRCHVTNVPSSVMTGFVSDIAALEIARVCRELGAGRSRADQELDLRVGVVLLRTYGDHVDKGEPWLEVHHAQSSLDPALRERLQAAIELSDDKPEIKSRIIDII